MAKSIIGHKRIRLSYAGWCLLWIGIQAYLLTQLGYGLATSITDASITQLIVALAGYIINTSMSFYQPSARNSVFIVTYSIALAGLCVAIQRFLITYTMRDIAGYSSFVDQSLFFRGLFDWLMILIIAILTWFWVYVADRQENEQRKEDAARLVRDAELSTLRMQLQPHFLFNSLNSISALIGANPSQARVMIQQLSDFLRGTVKREEREVVVLQEELQHLQLYLDIEKVRFGHRLSVLVHTDERSQAMQIPSLLLQPIVENAIKFGLYDTVGDITIEIKAFVANDALEIEVRNPFDPETSQPRRGTGFGLNSIQRRLYLLYYKSDLLSTQQEEKTFITRLKIPQTI